MDTETACLGIRLRLGLFLLFRSAQLYSPWPEQCSGDFQIAKNVKCTESVMSKLSPKQKPKQDYTRAVEAVLVEGELAGLEEKTLQRKLDTMYFSALTNSAFSSTDSALLRGKALPRLGYTALEGWH